MALVKHYRKTQYRAPNPARPGSTVLAERHVDSGTDVLAHDGTEYYADEDGWFDLPDHVAAEACKRGWGWMTPMDVEEYINAGLIKDTPTVVDPSRNVRSKPQAQVKASEPSDEDDDAS